ncbi:MAG: type I pantothenate kinase [Acidobacteria bacterium]|nr:type I pantothenate kinase [Acidobacteriota bacterium]
MTNHKVDSLTDSIYVTFDEEAWGRLRADTPNPLSEEELQRLRGINENVSLDEVAQIYLPMSRLLNLYVGGTQDLYRASTTFLGGLAPKVPYIIGIGGSVAVGKSTTGRILRELLARWPNHPQVDLVTTDGFLHPNAVLEERGLMERKGFPESFDIRTLVNFVLQVKSGERRVEHPVYSHHSYDILPGATEIIDQPDILILEGLNVLQARSQAPRSSRLMLSDLFDFSIYVDAETDVVERWYVERFLTFRNTAFRDPDAYFHRYASLRRKDAIETARSIWKSINEPNLIQNILPTRERADLILEKAPDHAVRRVRLRKL